MGDGWGTALSPGSQSGAPLPPMERILAPKSPGADPCPLLLPVLLTSCLPRLQVKLRAGAVLRHTQAGAAFLALSSSSLPLHLPVSSPAFTTQPLEACKR